jgi:hypothetical protein
VPIPAGQPDRSLLGFAREQLGDGWRPVETRLEEATRERRRLTEWLLAAEVLAVIEFRLQDRVPGLKMLTFGTSGDDDPQVTAHVLPQAVADNADLDPRAIPIRDADEHVVEVPIRVSRWELSLHTPVNLRYGTLCCWVKPTGGGHGLLTARHAVASDRLYLDDETVQPVLWYAPNCLDAAVAAAPDSHELTPLPSAVPLVGDDVEVRAKQTSQHRKITAVGQSYGTLTGAIPHVFLLDAPLSSGDSGSLVRLAGRRSGLGLYLGSLSTAEGPRGFCQGLHQLDRLFAAAHTSDGFYEQL